MISNSRRLAAVVATIAVVLSPAAPARADPAPWSMAPCATAGMDLEAAPEVHVRAIVIQGWVSQCGPTVVNGGFRIATYPATEPLGSAPGYNVRRFASTEVGSLRSFGAVAVPWTAGEYGVCVLAGRSERIGCYRVVVTGNGAMANAVAMPLAPDSSLVDKDVLTTPYTGSITPEPDGKHGHPQPACGTCF